MKAKFIKDFVPLDMAVYSESKDAVEGWLVNEIDFWKEILTCSYSERVFTETEVPEEVKYLLVLGEIKDGVQKTNGSLKRFGDQIKEANVSRRLPCFDEALSEDFKSAVVSEESFRMALFVYRASISASSAALEGFYKHWQTTMADEIKSSKESTFAELNNYQGSVNDRADEYLKAIQVDGSAKIELIRGEAEKAKALAIEEINNFASKVTDSVISNEPVKFWDDKRKHHRFRASMFSVFAMLLIAGVVCVLSKLLHMTYSSEKVQKIEFLDVTVPDHYLVALAILLGSVGVWVLRVLLKLMMTNLNLESEAHAKLTAIKTYVVLSKSKLSDETVNGFHKSLLQSGGADFSVEGTSPELVKIVELILQKREKP
jgi:hypothetical protein